MDAIANPTLQQSAEVKSQVRPDELLSILEYYAPKIKVLSLDCFDTLLWRKTATPTDVFYDLENNPIAKSHGFSTVLRTVSEINARKDRLFQKGLAEVKLEDIYRFQFPMLNDADLEVLQNEEIAQELETCYAYPPVVELIRAAQAKGLQIIIISDTYLTNKQLTSLLAAKLPEDAMAAISQVFCSCDIGIAKSSGLFKPVQDLLHITAKDMLHIGDNPIADHLIPQKMGVNAVQLLIQDDNIGEIMRMKALAACILDPTIRNHRGLSNAFRGVLSHFNYTECKSERALGYAAIGPIMYAFAKYIINEVAEIKREHNNTKVLFIMRDAYLPHLVCKEIYGEDLGPCVRISRFAAIASTLYKKDNIDRYLAENASSHRFRDMCTQLLVPDQLADSIIVSCNRASDPAMEFIRHIRNPNVLETITKLSLDYFKRLQLYLKNTINLEAGDKLVFVDLGYTGTAQKLLEPVFKEELNVEILGRYLLQLKIPGWKSSRKGLIDPSWCDDRSMYTLTTYISLFEQICTSNDKSVVDYDHKGQPIFTKHGISEEQHEKLIPIQSECVQFAHDAEKFFKAANTTLNLQQLRDEAMFGLTRFLFLPTERELDYLNNFQFDLNLGTNDVLQAFDQAAGLTGLRKRGLFFMEKNLKTMRTNYPAELRSAGLELVLMLMAHHRYGLDIRVSDLSLRRETLKLIVVLGEKNLQTTITAMPTHDGYFSVLIPIGMGNIKAGVVFGSHYHWVQLEAAEIIKTDFLYGSKESENTHDATKQLTVNNMTDRGGGLYECLQDTGMLVFMPNDRLLDGNHALRIVYRPIVYRQDDINTKVKT